MKKVFLHVGKLVALGFDESGEYLLTISHTGRGVFAVRTWERVARDRAKAYPKVGMGIGIGPIEGETIPVIEIDPDEGETQISSPDGNSILTFESDGIQVVTKDSPESA